MTGVCGLVLAVAVSTSFDVRDEGAKGDGRTDATVAIQRTIDVCSQAGGGRVVLPPGTYVSGPIRLKSGVELHLQRDARLLATVDMSRFREWTDVRHFETSALPRGRNACFIFADEADDIAITGEGVIDCNGGQHVVREPEDHDGWHYRRKFPLEKSLPRVVFFAGCKNVVVKDVSLVNSPAGWGYWIHDCDRVVFRKCRIESDVRYPNNDGIHINCSRDVEIAECNITTGDDSIIVRANSRSLAENRPCERVVVANCVLRSWSAGVRLGWTNDGVIRHCRFSNLKMRDTSVGIAFMLPGIAGYDYGREATSLEDVRFDGVEMDGIYGRPVLVWFQLADLGTRIGSIRDVGFRNVTSRGLEKPLLAGRLGCGLSGISFENCRFTVVPESELPNYRRHGAAAWDRYKLELGVCTDEVEVNFAAATRLAKKICEAITERGEARVALATGSDFAGLERDLSAHREIDWTKVSRVSPGEASLDVICVGLDANGGFVLGDETKPSPVTMAEVNAAKAVVAVATGGDRAEAVLEAVDGPQTNASPAAVLQSHSDCALILDRPAFSRLDAKWRCNRKRASGL